MAFSYLCIQMVVSSSSVKWISCNLSIQFICFSFCSVTESCFFLQAIKDTYISQWFGSSWTRYVANALLSIGCLSTYLYMQARMFALTACQIIAVNCCSLLIAVFPPPLATRSSVCASTLNVHNMKYITCACRDVLSGMCSCDVFHNGYKLRC